MPVAHINVLKGHERAKLKQLIADVSESMAVVLQAPKDRFMVWVTEVDPELWGIAGVPACEVLNATNHTTLELPFVEMVLLRGRPIEQHHQMIARVTDDIVRNLGSDRSRVRIHIADAAPESWGIGGTPASVLRAAEIKARQAQK